MADIVKTGNKTADSAMEDYREAALALALLALSGQITQSEYTRRHLALTENTLRAVFLLSGGNMTDPRATAWLKEQITIANNSARKLASDLYDGRYSLKETDGEIKQTADDGLAKLGRRLIIWTAMFGRAYHRAHLYPAVTPVSEIIGTWHVGPTEHCGTCLGLDGETKTAAAWDALAAIDVEPQGTGLDCGGYRCQCGITWFTRETAVQTR